jgi:hypothetical protein
VLFLLLVFPGGLGQIFYGLRDRYLRWVAARRGLLVPSLVADKRVVDDEILIAVEEDPPPIIDLEVDVDVDVEEGQPAMLTGASQ